MATRSAMDRTRAVELSLEAQATLADGADIDGREDAAMRRARTLCTALEDQLRTVAALDQLEDVARTKVREIIRELAGVLDGTPA